MDYDCHRDALREIRSFTRLGYPGWIEQKPEDEVEASRATAHETLASYVAKGQGTYEARLAIAEKIKQREHDEMMAEMVRNFQECWNTSAGGNGRRVGVAVRTGL